MNVVLAISPSTFTIFIIILEMLTVLLAFAIKQYAKILLSKVKEVARAEFDKLINFVKKILSQLVLFYPPATAE